MGKITKAIQPLVNAIWQFNKRSNRNLYGSNPHGGTRSFYSSDVDRILNGWTTQSNTINHYLRNDLPSLRARSRELVRTNTYAKRYCTLLQSNIVGEKGIGFQSRLMLGSGDMDTKANDAIEQALKEWSKGECDYSGQLSLIDIQNMLIKNVAQDGEYIIRIHEGAAYGKYGLRLQVMDAEELDIQKNEQLSNGNVVRLGVEYNRYNRPVRYHFREADINGNYSMGNPYTIDARYIIHGFMQEYPNQSRGIPWTHASLEALKQLDKYNESAIMAARYGAAKMLFLASDGTEGDEYKGDSVDELGGSLDHVEAGSIQDIGSRRIENYDPKYPHEMFPSFNKSILRSISSGFNISYAALASDLEDVNYSSIRAGVLEDRELYKSLQGWFIRSFMRPVVERWLKMAILKGAIVIGNRPLSRPVDQYLEALYFQGRRWAWTDPQKDTQSNISSIDARIKSRSQVIRDQGDDPESVWAELAREDELMRKLGLTNEPRNE